MMALYSSEQLDKGVQVDVVYTDFQKAFDKVSHISNLLRKMERLGFTPSTITFFRSYLIERRQYVMYKGKESHEFQCPSGVEQGSNLGPLLFNIFIYYDIGNVMKRAKLLLGP